MADLESNRSSSYPRLGTSPAERLAAHMRQGPPELDEVSRARGERNLVLAWRAKAAARVSLAPLVGTSRGLNKRVFVASVAAAALAGAAVGLLSLRVVDSTPAALAQFALVLGDTTVQSGSVAEGQTLEAGRHGHIEVSLEGSRLDIARDSRVRFDRISHASTRLSLVRGTIDVEFHPSEPGKQQLQVETHAARVQVVGTRFQVSVDSRGDTRVSVTEGVVKVLPRQGAEVQTLRAGEQTLVPMDPGDSYERAVREAIASNLRYAPTDEAAGPVDELVAADELDLDPTEAEVAEETASDEPTVRRVTVAQRLEAARRMLRQGRHAPARARLREIANGGSAIRYRVEALTLIAESFTAQGYIPRATDSYRRAAHIAPGHRAGHNALFALARLLERYTQDQQAASSAYRRYLAQAPNGALANQAREALCRLGNADHCSP